MPSFFILRIRIVFAVIFLISMTASAQPVSDAELTRRQSLQKEAAQSRVNQAPDVFTELNSDESTEFILPQETPCFKIQDIEWRGIDEFNWLIADGMLVNKKCLGAKGLRAFQNYLTRQLISKGYVTSRVLIPEQNLALGRLTLQVLPGHIGELRDQGDAIGRSSMVFPGTAGKLLNQRDLDQALENIRRLAGQQEVEFDLAPGKNQGDTDIVIKHPTVKPWRFMVTLDDSGAPSTGKYQLGGILSVDSPLHLYDALTITLNNNANFTNDTLGTNSNSINWSMPYGYWSLLFDANQSSYKQTVAGFSGDIVYGGHSYGMDIGLATVLYRSASAKGAFQFKLNRKVSRSQIDDTDVAVQYQNVTGYETTLTHHQYLGSKRLDLSYGVKGSLPQYSSAPGLIVGAPDWDGRFQIQIANASLVAPFQLSAQNLRYQGSLRIQHANTILPVSEYFSIGNRYSVRGFDGASTLAAESGWLLRNDLIWPGAMPRQEFFFGLDSGHVSGPNAGILLGTSLSGAVLGIRGQFDRFNYEITCGRPLAKPAGFNTQQLTLTASIAAEF